MAQEMLSASCDATPDDPRSNAVQPRTRNPWEDFDGTTQVPYEWFTMERERTGINMMSDITMLTISIAINVAIIMLAMILRDT